MEALREGDQDPAELGAPPDDAPGLPRARDPLRAVPAWPQEARVQGVPEGVARRGPQERAGGRGHAPAAARNRGR
eukprot:1641117-Alexandrium_andersonii.AAC.1